MILHLTMVFFGCFGCIIGSFLGAVSIKAFDLYKSSRKRFIVRLGCLDDYVSDTYIQHILSSYQTRYTKDIEHAKRFSNREIRQMWIKGFLELKTVLEVIDGHSIANREKNYLPETHFK